MNKYIFIVESSQNLSKIRSQIENLNLDKWVHVSTNVITNMTDLSKEEIIDSFNLAKSDQLLIADFNSFCLKNWRNDMETELSDRGYTN